MKVQNILISEIVLDRELGMAEGLATVHLAGPSTTQLVSVPLKHRFELGGDLDTLKQLFTEDAIRWMGLMNLVPFDPVQVAA